MAAKKSADKQPANSQEQLKMVALPTADLLKMAAPYNPRVINEHDFKALCRSMSEFGVVEPIVCNKHTQSIVGGHQRVKAAAVAEIESLPVVWVDLDKQQERLLNLALNRIHGQWDDAALTEVLAGLKEFGADLDLSGFNSHEMELILNGWEGEGLEGLGGGAGHTEGIHPRIVVECLPPDKERVKQLITEAVSDVDGCVVK